MAPTFSWLLVLLCTVSLWIRGESPHSPPHNTIPLSLQCQLQAFNNIEQKDDASATTPKDWTKIADDIMTVYKETRDKDEPFPHQVIYQWDKDVNYPKHDLNYPVDLSNIKGPKEPAYAGWAVPFVYYMFKRHGYIADPMQRTFDADPCPKGSEADFIKYWEVYKSFTDDSNKDEEKHVHYPKKSYMSLALSELNRIKDAGWFAIEVTVGVGEVGMHQTVVINNPNSDDDEYWYLENNQHRKPVSDRTWKRNTGQGVHGKAYPGTHDGDPPFRILGVHTPLVETIKNSVEKHIFTGYWYDDFRKPGQDDGKMRGKLYVEYTHKIGDYNALVKWLEDKVSLPKNRGGAAGFVIWKKGGPTLTHDQLVEEYCTKCGLGDAPAIVQNYRREQCKPAIDNLDMKVNTVPFYIFEWIVFDVFSVFMLLCIGCSCFVVGSIYGVAMAEMEKKI